MRSEESVERDEEGAVVRRGAPGTCCAAPLSFRGRRNLIPGRFTRERVEWKIPRKLGMTAWSGALGRDVRAARSPGPTHRSAPTNDMAHNVGASRLSPMLRNDRLQGLWHAFRG